jgi:pimeloyl-ACP methyl ester carboxylesterase
MCTAPLRLAAGSNDQMVSLKQMQVIDPAAVTIEGAGHNAHWEAPERVWQFFEEAE